MEETTRLEQLKWNIYIQQKGFQRFLETSSIIADLWQLALVISLGYGMGIGQNTGWGHADWETQLQSWFDEVHDFKWGVGSTNREPVGHYTQVNTAIGVSQASF